MISPDDFYADREYPTRSEKRLMWDHIDASLGSHNRPRWQGIERRSFLYGIAAAVVLMFAAVGVYATISTTLERTQPAAMQIDRAYQSAISEFEKVAVRYDRPSDAGITASRQEQLEVLESAISALRSETGPRDISPLVRSRLRELYAKKLALLQVMVEQGDIAL